MNKFIKVCLWICLGCGVLGGAALAVGIGFGGSQVWNQGVAQVEASSIIKQLGQKIKHQNWNGVFVDLEDNQETEEYNDYDDSEFDKSLRQTNSFQSSEVNSLDLSVKYGAVEISETEDNQIKVVMDSNNSACQFTIQNKNGKLTIQDSRMKYSNRNKRRVTIYLPKGVRFKQVSMDIGAGEVQLDTTLTADDYVIDIGAGNLEGQMEVKDCTIECGLGNVNLEGSITGNAKISCGMGNLEMDLKGSQNNHNYSLECGMGQLTVGDVTIAGSGKQEIDYGHSDSVYTISCGMGNVTIDFE